MSSIASPTTPTRRAAIFANTCSRWSRVRRGSGVGMVTGGASDGAGNLDAYGYRGNQLFSRAHVSPAGAHRGGARHHLRRTHRTVRRRAGAGDRVLEADAGPPRNRRAGDVGREQGAGSGEQDFARNTAPCSRLPAPFDDAVRSTPGGALLVLDRIAALHQRRQLGRPRVAQVRLRLGPRGPMAARPMLVGHTGMNYALRHFRATTVNVAALGEPVGATVLAWLIPAIHEAPRATALVGGVLVLLGITLSLTAGNGKRETGNVGSGPHGAFPVSRFSFPGRGRGREGSDAR